MKEHANTPPAPIVDSFMVGGEAIASISGQPTPPERWVVWFAFPDERSLQLAQREKCALIARTMKHALKQSGYPAALADNLDLRFCSKEAIDKAGPDAEFLEQQLAPAGRVESGIINASILKTFLSPSRLMGFAGLLVLLFGDYVGLSEGLKWIVGLALIIPSTIIDYWRHRRMKGEFRADVARAGQALGFRALPDSRQALKALGLLDAGGFRGNRLRWALERADATGKAILACAQRGSVGDETTHYLVSCRSLAGSRLPDFDLRPETTASRMAAALGGQDLDFDANAAFSDRYRLRAGDEASARLTFRPEVLNFFVRGGDDELWSGGWYAQARAGWLIVHRPHLSEEMALHLLPVFQERTQELFELLTARR